MVDDLVLEQRSSEQHSHDQALLQDVRDACRQVTELAGDRDDPIAAPVHIALHSGAADGHVSRRVTEDLQSS
jgi:hypothetical protein